MLTISAEIDGFDHLSRKLSEAPIRLDGELERAMVKSTFLVEAAVKSHTPRVTGRLFSSVQGTVESPLHGRVATDVHYAPFVEDGRGPVTAQHLTKSGRPGYLRFRKAGQYIFRRNVGPALGRHMFREGLAESIGDVRALFRRAVHDALD